MTNSRKTPTVGQLLRENTATQAAPLRQRRAPCRMTEAEATQVLDEQSYDPKEPYSGRCSFPWRAVCRRCEAEVWVRPKSLAERPRRTTCRHPFSSIIVPARARRERAEQARQERGDQ